MNNRSILIVDDEVLVARDLRNRLQRMNYEVVGTAHKAREAIVKAAELRPALVLMDINLKDDIDGVDAAIEIGKSLDIPVVFCSAYSNEDALERAKRAEPYGYLLKPFDNRELEIVIEIAILKHNAERDLVDSTTRLNGTLSSVDEGIIAVNSAGEVSYVNPVAERMIGLRVSMLGPHLLTDLLRVEPLTNGGECAAFLNQSEPWRDVRALRQCLINTNGEKIPVELSVNSFMSQGTELHVLTLRDIRDQIDFEASIRETAFFDEVTGLPNRSLFVNRLESSINRRRRNSKEQFAVLFLDLDGFGVINEGLGHQEGDLLMRVVAERIAETLRPDDTVSRFGGDIYAILLEPVDSANGAIIACQRILDRITAPIELSGGPVDISASVGIALGVDSSKSAEEMVRDANNALNRAKLDNKGSYVVFDTEMYQNAKRFIARKAGIQKALVEGSFQIYYQPVVDVHTEQLVSMEALIRWPHPEEGMVSPAEFIPIAEKTGLIVPLGEFVLRRVCRQIRSWNDDGFTNFRVAVNLSSQQFDNDIATQIDGIMKEYRVSAHSLGLEITEGVAMKDVEGNVAKLHELRQLGLNLSIDDFGTGYSSLAYLKRFPINTLKIDRAFICDITESDDDREITRAIIAMGQSLQLKVLAEGVETIEQANLLRENGCDYIQGYYYSKPLPAAEVLPYLQDGCMLTKEHVALTA